MRLEGDHGQRRAEIGATLRRLADDRLVPEMHTVEVSDGYRSSASQLRDPGNMPVNPHGEGLGSHGPVSSQSDDGRGLVQSGRRLGTQRTASPSITTFSPIEQTTSQQQRLKSGSSDLTVTRV